ncbi:uncharacterized protein METZ01_LOCUS272495, partial [marine metagenome]
MVFSLQKFFLTTLLFIITLLTLLVFGQLALALPSPASIEYEKARLSYHGFFHSKKRMIRRDKWVLVIQKFERIYRNHFPSNESYKAIFTVGDLYEQLYSISRRNEDLDAALKAYQNSIKKFKPGRLTDDALYRQGEIFFNQEKYEAALDSFEKVSTLTPKGDFVAKARSRVIEVRSFLSKRRLAQVERSKKIKEVFNSKNNSNLTDGKELTLKKIDYKVGADSVKVVVHASDEVTFSQGRLSKPERVYINFNKTRLGNNVAKNIKIGSRFLKGLRLSQFDKENTRLVFDLNQSNNLKVGVWPEGSKLLIELSNQKLFVAKVASKSKVSITPKNVDSVKKLKR